MRFGSCSTSLFHWSSSHQAHTSAGRCHEGYSQMALHGPPLKPSWPYISDYKLQPNGSYSAKIPKMSALGKKKSAKSGEPGRLVSDRTVTVRKTKGPACRLCFWGLCSSIPCATTSRCSHKAHLKHGIGASSCRCASKLAARTMLADSRVRPDRTALRGGLVFCSPGAKESPETP